MQKKLKIDTATAIVDIIAAVIAILAPILIMGNKTVTINLSKTIQKMYRSIDL